jgi:hypothetical protein
LGTFQDHTESRARCHEAVHHGKSFAIVRPSRTCVRSHIERVLSRSVRRWCCASFR